MDYSAIIKAMRVQLEALDRTIAHLEYLNSPDRALPKRRGRKSMSPEEAQQVSDRMKRYWATRRSQK